jgi:methylmalonyl-CoA/ethylmalonyl-CoA epimerase
MLIDHTGIAVLDMTQAIATYSKLLNVQPTWIERLEDRKLQLAFFDLGPSSIELLCPDADSPSPIAKFLQKHGEGIHHVAFKVDDIRAELKRLKENSFTLIDEVPRSGARGSEIAFIMPQSCNGVLVELVESHSS